MGKYGLWMPHDCPFKIALVNQNYLLDVVCMRTWLTYKEDIHVIGAIGWKVGVKMKFRSENHLQAYLKSDVSLITPKYMYFSLKTNFKK